MHIESLKIPDVKLIIPEKIEDSRGFFSETYRKDFFCKNISGVEFVQDNHSFSRESGTIRGIHFQKKPYAQAKLVRVVRGRIWDVAVDLRHGSPHYSKWVAVELSSENFRQLFIPEGFGHAFLTLAPDTEVCYKVSAYYNVQADAGVHYLDPDIAVKWPEGAIVHASEKDKNLPFLKNLAKIFSYA